MTKTMLYLQPKVFTKFLLLVHALFLISCRSASKYDTPALEKQKMNDTSATKLKNLQFIHYTQDNWKIIRQNAIYENGIEFSSISSIWFYDQNFPLEIVTIDNLTPHEASFASYQEGDKINLRNTNAYFPAAESLTTELYDSKFPPCQKNEFRMFARIYNELIYTGVDFDNKNSEKTPWFKFGNIICVSINKEDNR